VKRREPLLTRSQLAAWATFGREWEPFKQAWLGRGFLHPPSGSPDDDPEETNSQRALLWQVVDAQPTNIARWVREAPGRTPRAVIAFVLERWHSVRNLVGPDEDELDVWTIVARRAEDDAGERLRDIIRRLGT